MKELRVESYLKNNRLKTLRERSGLSQGELARRAGVTLSTIGILERFATTGRRAPRATYRGCPTGAAKLARYFGVEFDWLFPADIYESVSVSRTQIEVSREECAGLFPLAGIAAGLLTDQRDMEGKMDDARVPEKVSACLRTLTPRDERILRIYFGIGEESELTQREVGQRFAVSGCRVGQIKARALARLRYPPRHKTIEQFVEGVD
jgi:transcriptional regulator with XRE-family HTH domain